MTIALKHLHKEVVKGNEKYSLIHRNISPESVMMSLGGEFILGDMSLIKPASSKEKLISTLPTYNSDQLPFYMAPEIMKNEYDKKVDIWSLGCLIYEMCTLQPAFTEEEILRLRTDPKLPHIPEYYSEDLNDLIKNMLKFSPEKRFDCENILNSEYVKKYINHSTKIPSNLEVFLENPKAKLIYRIYFLNYR